MLCLSYDKNPVELLTISSRRGLRSDSTEPNFAHNLPPPLPSLAEDSDSSETTDRGDGGQIRVQGINKTACKFDDKRIYVLSARVHPGETPASHVMKGCLDFLLREDDRRSEQLRDQFVFKIIPIINPDGVLRGHYRTDARGQNLNRHYTEPDPNLQPQCYAYRQMMTHLHSEYKVESQTPKSGRNINPNADDGTVEETTNS